MGRPWALRGASLTQMSEDLTLNLVTELGEKK